MMPRIRRAGEERVLWGCGALVSLGVVGFHLGGFLSLIFLLSLCNGTKFRHFRVSLINFWLPFLRDMLRQCEDTFCLHFYYPPLSSVDNQEVFHFSWFEHHYYHGCILGKSSFGVSLLFTYHYLCGTCIFIERYLFCFVLASCWNL